MSSYEDKIVRVLRAGSIKFVREKTFEDLKKGRYRFDFYISTRRILIEVDGQYHWNPIRGYPALLKQKEHDRRKNSYCLAHNIPLYRIPYWEIDNIKQVGDIFQKKFLVKTKFHNDLLKIPK